MAEFRWILVVLGVVLIAGIWWWGRRRSTQAPGNAQLREVSPASLREPEFAPEPRIVAEPRERSVTSFEPVSIDTADFDRLPHSDGPIMVDIEPADVKDHRPLFEPESAMPPVLTRVARVPEPDTGPEVSLDEEDTQLPWSPPAQPQRYAEEARASVPPPEPASPSPAPSLGRNLAARRGEVPTVLPEGTDRISTAAPQTPNTAEKQKIVTLRVSAPEEARWAGSALLAAFELNGLAYGKYQVFHRRHVDGRSLFCVASITEPGTFDVTKMQTQEFKGVTLFAVLPGPIEPLLTVDELLSAAGELAAMLHGSVQDARGVPLTAQRAAAIRDEVARFQASLAVARPA